MFTSNNGLVTLYYKGLNDENETIYDNNVLTLTISPILQIPFGFWRNDTSYIINIAFINYLENMNFNYSCKPIQVPSNGNRYIFQELKMVYPMPLVSFMTKLTLPIRIENLGIIFCEVVNVVHNIESDSFGFVFFHERLYSES
jgi:hypothetical protein